MNRSARRLSAAKAARIGLRRALGSPWILFGLWAVQLVVALPATWLVAQSIETSIGASTVGENLRAGFDMDWYGEYRSEASGLATTFGPRIAGRGAVFDNLEDWVTGELFTGHAGLLAVGAVWGVAWLYLLGGVLSRFTGPPHGGSAEEFFRDGGAHFLRFLRLALLSAVVYAGVYLLAEWSFGWVGEALRDATSERAALLYAGSVWALTAVLLVLVHVCFDYAKIAVVVDGRRSALLAAVRGVRFVLAHPARTLWLYLMFAIVAGALIAFYAVVAPTAGPAKLHVVVGAFAFGQLFLVARLAVRLALLAAQATLYRALTPAVGDAS